MGFKTEAWRGCRIQDSSPAGQRPDPDTLFVGQSAGRQPAIVTKRQPIATPMRARKTNHLALTLLVAAGLGACAGSAKAQGTTQKKSASSNSRSSSHRPNSSKKSPLREPVQKDPPPDRISWI